MCFYGGQAAPILDLLHMPTRYDTHQPNFARWSNYVRRKFLERIFLEENFYMHVCAWVCVNAKLKKSCARVIN